jgi:hypothetical protein
MGESEPPWIDTEPATWVRNEDAPTVSGMSRRASPGSLSPWRPAVESPIDLVNHGLFAKLVPQNRSAREAFDTLAKSSGDRFEHHRQFVQIDTELRTRSAGKTGCFIFSLGLLPQFPSLGWRIGKGRPRVSNLSVDILLPNGDGVAGLHGRFSWLKGTGGFFIIADNARGLPITLNGEVLLHTQRMIPYRNTISFGECYFSVQFETRTPDQEEQFQLELTAFYSRILEDAIPLVLPTPSEHETRIGNWVVRNPISSGGYGRVSVVTHAQTGVPAAMKELWETPWTSRNIKREIAIAELLKDWRHVSIQS